MKVYFAHGKESGPWGSKISRLATIAKAQGCAVESIDYQGIDDPEHRVELLVSLLQQANDQVLLVGSSMSAYVSLVASEIVASEMLAAEQAVSQNLHLAGLFLLAPALYIPGYRVQAYRPQHTHIEVVHGWSDEVIPAAHSVRFAQAQHCSLHLIPGDHRLNSSLHLVEPLFSQFIVAALANLVSQHH